MPVDYIEVTRAAHQISLDHGSRAHHYAEKLANAAATENLNEDAAFWRSVATALQPREVEGGKILLEGCIAPRLKALGFGKKARTWWRSSIETIGVINIQKSPYGTGIYVNLGVYVKQLGHEQRPPEYRCHVRVRLDDVAADGLRSEIIAAESNLPPSEALIHAVLTDGVSWLDRLSTLDGIRDHIKSGGGHAVLSVRELVGP